MVTSLTLTEGAACYKSTFIDVREATSRRLRMKGALLC